MPTSLILTVIGADRPGLIESLARTVALNEGNWVESRMARLAGKFSGILLVSIPDANVEKLTKDLLTLESEGLRFSVETGITENVAGGWRIIQLEVVGLDRPGMIRDISHVFAARNINVEDLETSCIDGSWSGETMFQAQIQVRVPEDVSTDELKKVLEKLGNDLMVDIMLEEPVTSSRGVVRHLR